MSQKLKPGANGKEGIAPVLHQNGEELSQADLDKATGGKAPVAKVVSVTNGDPCDGSEYTH